MIFATCLFIAAPAAYAWEDDLYPFLDVCGDYIDEYCAGVDALGDCMVAHEPYLAGDCYDSVFFWAGNHFDFHSDYGREHWHSMTPPERRAYVSDNREAFRSHAERMRAR